MSTPLPSLSENDVFGAGFHPYQRLAEQCFRVCLPYILPCLHINQPRSNLLALPSTIGLGATVDDNGNPDYPDAGLDRDAIPGQHMMKRVYSLPSKIGLSGIEFKASSIRGCLRYPDFDGLKKLGQNSPALLRSPLFLNIDLVPRCTATPVQGLTLLYGRHAAVDRVIGMVSIGQSSASAGQGTICTDWNFHSIKYTTSQKQIPLAVVAFPRRSASYHPRKPHYHVSTTEQPGRRIYSPGQP